MKTLAAITDAAMCVAINVMQRRQRLPAGYRAVFEDYIARCEGISRERFYDVPGEASVTFDGHWLRGASPLPTGFAENDHWSAWISLCGHESWSAPTVFLLHALMSAGDEGYKRCARRFNERGWNACFFHLPFHYSRTPAGHRNGALAITADLMRTGEALRAAVLELRIAMRWLRSRGTETFGLWATSYGGWIGALLASVERGFGFHALMAPVVNVHHAIWVSGAAWSLRRELRRADVPPELVARHFHLSSPMHGMPLDGRTFLIGGSHDTIVPVWHLRELQRRWSGSKLIVVPQGHFGFQMAEAAWQAVMA